MWANTEMESIAATEWELCKHVLLYLPNAFLKLLFDTVASDWQMCRDELY